MSGVDDPFAESEDWSATQNWPHLWMYRDRDPRWPKQRQIVERNASLLNDWNAWRDKVGRFEDALSALTPSKVEEKRREYLIRFDGHRFGDGEKQFGIRSFPCPVTFDRVHFGSGDIYFADSRFEMGDVSFNEAQFGPGNIRFDQSHLNSGDIAFYNCRFSDGDICFDEAILNRCRLIFKDCVFGLIKFSFFKTDIKNGNLYIAHSRISGPVSCYGLNVADACFHGTSIDGVADFAETRFGCIPDFRQTRLDRPPEVARMEVPKPILTHTISETEQEKRGLPKRHFWQQVAQNGDDVLKLRKLKAMALAANDHEKDGEFFAYEMMAKRGVEHTTIWQLFANTFYWQVSDYGQSYVRPFAWLFFTTLAFAIVYALMATPPIGGLATLGFGLLFSLKSSLPFLGAIIDAVPSPEDHESWFADRLASLADSPVAFDWFTSLASIQSVLGAVFFFFLLLGLRNKFRLK